jgi:hypothetical protein
MRPPSRLARVAIFVAAALAVAACVVATNNDVRELLMPASGVAVRAPTRMHLRDGGVAVFELGFRVSADSALGRATRYSALRDTIAVVAGVALADVTGAETFVREAAHERTLLYSAGLVAGIAGFKMVFGSCPTIYSLDGDSTRLESEAFSYSIAPLLEKRDVDLLAAGADHTGALRLEVRNEALETHQLDHMELVEVPHAVGETVLPSPFGDPVAVAEWASAATARDRAGRDVRGLLAAADDLAFGTHHERLARAAASDDPADQEDWIDVTVPRPAGADSVALVLRMRSSLLTTILFYDYMLARPGARALDWQAEELGRITTIAQLGRWYTGRLGLRVQVRDDGEFRPVARLVDFGPIAWRNVAVVVPAAERDSVRIRVSFLADEWRIDRAAVASRVRRVPPRTVPLSRVTDRAGTSREDARRALAAADGRYLTTMPGDRFEVHFQPGPSTSARTFLVATQGYYTEWVRGEWLRAPVDSAAFDPRRVRLSDVLRTWIERKPAFEREFFARDARVPVL